MQLKTLLLIGAAVLPMMAGARQLSPDEALSRATAQNTQKAPAANIDAAARLVYTASTGSEADLYVFNNPAGRGGFVIVSADDAYTPLVGYSESGSFDYSEANPSLKWWLQLCQRDVRMAANNPAMHALPIAEGRQDIAPMIQTKWDQDSPYNNECPKVMGTQTVTGCVATAMAQVMNYHKWPLQGTGSNSYNVNGIGEVSLNFSSVNFDWDNMLNSYRSGATDAQKQAVATLMYACGVSVNMDYGVSFSGASAINISGALVRNFGYDKGVQYIHRVNYEAAEWEEILYNELQAARPVLYSGRTADNSGHSFVCDGYRDGYYHINWGWGGMSDGYYLLPVLNPELQGIGGAADAFAFDQSMVIGIQKPVPDSVERITLVADGFFDSSAKTYRQGDNVGFYIYNDNYDFSTGFVRNYSYFDINIYPAIKLTDAYGTVKYMRSDKSVFVNGVEDSHYFGYGPYSVKVDGLSDGRYLVTPAYFNDATSAYSEIRMDLNTYRPLYLTVSGSNLNFKLEDAKDTDVAVTNFSLDTPLFVLSPFIFSADFYAAYDQALKVQVMLLDPDTNTMRLSTSLFYVGAVGGETTHFSSAMSFVYQNSNLGYPVPGEYDLMLVDENDSPLSDRIRVELKEQSASVISLENLYVENSDKVVADNVVVKGTVKCESGVLIGTLPIYVFLYPEFGTNVDYIETPVLYANEGETADFEIKADLSSLKIGRKYVMMMLIGDSWADNHQAVFYLDSATGIASVEMDALETDGQMYDLLGRPVSNPTKGIYIVNGKKVLVK